MSAALLMGCVVAGDNVAAAGRGGDRVVHHFDFDERDEGNIESLPKYWDVIRPMGFPHFTRGAFDESVGRNGAPSFHLETLGRNVAFAYTGPDTRVRPNTDYHIVGYISPDRLKYGRACLSAHYLDQSGRPLVESLVRSRWVGGPDDVEPWIRLDMDLPAAPPTAERIGITVWVVQEPVWSDALFPKRHIQRNDVRGGAWFDDITVHALPRMRLTTSTPTNVLSPDDEQVLYALLADYDDRTLRGRVSIRLVGGAVVKVVGLEVETDPNAEAKPISIAELGPGLYRATLDIFAGDALLRSRELTFAKLAPRRNPQNFITRSFGIVIDPQQRSDPAWELALLERQALHSAKLPVWSGLSSEAYTDSRRQGMERLAQDLVKRGFALSGVFLAPPASIVRNDGAYTRPLLELLSGDQSLWRGHLATAVAPSASAFRWWEIIAPIASTVGSVNRLAGGLPGGGDGDQLAAAISQLRSALRPFITFPRIAMPVSATVDLATEKFPVEQVTLNMTAAVRPESFATRIGDARKLGYENVSVLVESPPAKRYRRLPRLADWGRRLIMARHAGADTVFVPQTWRVGEAVGGHFVAPNEEFLVLRTIADILGDASPGPELRIGEHVRCLSFHNDKSSVLALWDEHAPSGGRDYLIQLGNADRQVDLWGRSTTLTRAKDGRQIVRLGSLPVFIPKADRWLIEFRASLSITPTVVPSGSEAVRHEIVLDYEGERRVSGRIDWELPKGWAVGPKSFDFGVSRFRRGRQDIEIVYPHIEPAGAKTIRARITLNPTGLYLEVPLRVDIEAPDLEVSGMAVVESGELVLRQVVTNRSDEVLSFRVSAAVPGRQRQYRPISNLRPGDTQSVQYRFGGGEAFVGRHVRISLREVNDGPRTHNLDLLVP